MTAPDTAKDRHLSTLGAVLLFIAGLLSATLVFVLVSSASVYAADAPGCRDPFGLKRVEADRQKGGTDEGYARNRRAELPPQ